MKESQAFWGFNLPGKSSRGVLESGLSTGRGVGKDFFTKPDFVIPAGSSLHLFPTLNDTFFEEDWIHRFIKSIDHKTLQLLEGMQHFSRITYGTEQKSARCDAESGVDYMIQLSLSGHIGGICSWGMDLYNQEGQVILTWMDENKVAHGGKSEKDSVNQFMEFAKTCEYLKETIPLSLLALIRQVSLSRGNFSNN